MKQVVDSFLSTDGLRRVLIFARADGSFGFEDSRRDAEDRAWLPFGRYSHAIIDTSARALAEARGRVDWLLTDAADRSSLPPSAITHLLDALCVELGFCLAPFERDILLHGAPAKVDAMTTAVFRAEGIDPKTASSDLVRSVRERVEAVYSASTPPIDA